MPAAVSAAGLTIDVDGRCALHDLTFSLSPGAFVGIVGSSGSGKTILLHAIAGLVRPSCGSLALFGRSLDNWTDTELRSAVAVVPQHVGILSGTVEDNICFGDIEPERLARAIYVSGLEKDLAQWSSHLQTTVGEAGVRLSGGQRQRIGIARALYRTPMVLLFDDALCSIDADTAEQIRQRLTDCYPGMTILCTTARPSAAQRADRILVLRNGRIVGDGCHDILCARPGEYARLCLLERLEGELQ